MRIVSWDLETTDLKALMGRILCCSFIEIRAGHGAKPYTFRADRAPWKGKRLIDDGQLAVAIRNELEKYHMIVGWNCLDGSTPILTRDLRWVPAQTLQAGDELIGIGKPLPRRHYLPTTVDGNAARTTECAEVRFSDGTQYIASLEHPWLVANTTGRSSGPNGYRWVTTRNLGEGRQVQRLLHPWRIEYGYDAGWLAGFFDGEGCLTAQEKDHSEGIGWSCAASQRVGPVLERATALLTQFGFRYSVRAYDHQQPHMRSVVLLGGKQAIFEFLGRIRPVRLLQKFSQQAQLGAIKGDNRTFVEVRHVKPIGLHSVAVLGTASETYVAHGFGAHNSKLFDAPFLNSRLLKAGERPLKPQFHLDLMWYAGGASNRIGSRKLVNVQKFLGLAEAKTDITWENWQEAALGDSKAYADVVHHCEQDVKVLAQAYWHLLPAVATIHR